MRLKNGKTKSIYLGRNKREAERKEAAIKKKKQKIGPLSGPQAKSISKEQSQPINMKIFAVTSILLAASLLVVFNISFIGMLIYPSITSTEEIVSGSVNATNNTITLVSTLASGNTSAGDVWMCSIMVSDGVFNTTWQNSTGITINADSNSGSTGSSGSPIGGSNTTIESNTTSDSSETLGETINETVSGVHVSKNKTTEITFDEHEIPVNKLLIKSDVDIENMTVAITPLDEESAPKISEIKLKAKYKYFEITTSHSNLLSGANITFFVYKDWMKENNLKSGEIVLLRYNSGAWHELKTTPLRKNNETRVYFTAETPGFSMFSIVAKTFEAGHIICESYEKKCFDNELKECSAYGTNWILTEKCQFGCINGNCKLEGATEMEGIISSSIWIIIVVFVMFLLMIYIHIKTR